MSGPEWRAEWSCGFDTKRYPDEVYEELVARGSELSGADFEVLGAWKDGTIRRGGQRQFGHHHVHFTDNWKRNAVCAYTVWKLFREQHNFHYAELEAMPSEPPAPPESAPPPPVKAAVQLPLF